MAGRRKSWDSLSPAYRQRLSRGGVTKEKYESGANLSAARGHARTPEHPREAAKRPERYPEYVQKRQAKQKKTPTPQEQAISRNRRLDNAFRNFDARLGDYIKYNRTTVAANVYGGELPDGTDAPGMSDEQAIWTANADAEEIRSRASEQYRGNPWWYH